jgi:uncharacterized protein YegP (UPF0339 family)
MATGTRSTGGTLNGTATKARSEPEAGASRFEIFQENSGRYTWQLTGGDGCSLARSCESFASRDDAERAVEQIGQMPAGVEA